MKICWDNLEKLEYRPDRGMWIDIKWKTNFYVYKEKCKNCNEPFLTSNNGIYCCSSCSYLFTRKGYKHSEKTKRKIGLGNKDKICSEETKLKISKAKTGQLPWNTGKCLSREHKNKLRDRSWKGGYYTNNIPFYDTYAPQISFCEEVRRNKEDPNILEIKCAYCGKWFVAKMMDVINRIRALNGYFSSEHKLYCSNECKKECPIYYKHKYQVGHPKSNKSEYSREAQPELRQMCFERDDYTCQKCGKPQAELDVGLHCHHLTGVELNPIESADIDNCITLCKTCHKEVHTLPGCGYSDFRRKKCEE